MGATTPLGYTYPDESTTLAALPLGGPTGSLASLANALNNLPWIYLTAPAFGGDKTGATDSTPALLKALAALPASGGVIVVPDGNYIFSQVINFNKLVYILGGVAGVLSAGQHASVNWTYTGALSTAGFVTFSGSAATGSRMHGINLNSANAAVDSFVDIETSEVCLDNVTCQTPTVQATTAGILVGNQVNVVDTYMRDVFFRTSAPIGLDVIRTSALLLGDHVIFNFHSAANVSLGTTTTPCRGVTFVNNCHFEQNTNIDCVVVAGQTQYLVIEDGCYFEHGGTGQAVNILSTCLIAEGIRIGRIHVTCAGAPASIITVAMPFATVFITQPHVDGLANNGSIVKLVGARLVDVDGYHANGVGITAFDTRVFGGKVVGHEREGISTNPGVANPTWAVGYATGAITSGALPVFNPASGVALQADAARDRSCRIPVTYNPTGIATATLQVEISPDNTTFTTTETVTLPALAALAGTILPVVVQLPAGWWLRLTAVNATIGGGHSY